MNFRLLLAIAVGGILGTIAEAIDRRYRRAERLFWRMVARIKL